jgi:hypothetical protein
MTGIYLKVPDHIREAAKKHATNTVRYKNSIRGGEGNTVGYIGEWAVSEVLGGSRVNTPDYDILWDGKRIEVKTKERNVPPRGDFNASIPAFNTKQKCDFYAFVSVLSNGKGAWYLGKIGRGDFYSKATFSKKGEPDGSNKNFKFRADCYNMPYSELDLDEGGANATNKNEQFALGK